VGAQNAPSLLAGPWQHGSGSYEDIVKTITTGVPRDQIKDPSHRFQMNPRGGGQAPLNDDQVKTVAAYVWSISRKK
jgi:mono/diheme cytochrome c family protein